MQKTLLTLTAVALAGCASAPPPDPRKLYLLVESDPPGAQIVTIANGSPKEFGHAPRTITYDISATSWATDKMQLAPLTANWASGATTSTAVLQIDLRIGNQQAITLRRPDGVAGLEADLRIAADMERQRASAQRAQSSSGEGLAIGLQFLNAYIEGRNEGARQASGQDTWRSAPYEPPKVIPPVPSTTMTCRPLGNALQCSQH